MQHLYRHFDKDGSLLYIGVSLSAVKRLGQHKAKAHWYEFISRVEIESFETREYVLEAERIAIITEKPRYNLKIPVERKEKKLKRSIVIDVNGLKAKIIKHYGGSINEAARQIGITRQRIERWPDELTQLQKDALIGLLVRSKRGIPSWLLK